METSGNIQVRSLQRYEGDTNDFIGYLLQGWFKETQASKIDKEEKPQPGMVVFTTIQKRYTIDDFRRIIETPSHVLSYYKLKFMNDQVIVTVKVFKSVALVQEEEEA